MWVIFAIQDPDPNSGSGSGYGSTDLIESGSNLDPKHWVFKRIQSLLFHGSVGAYIIYLKGRDQ
jgi:hypothetical protein